MEWKSLLSSHPSSFFQWSTFEEREDSYSFHRSIPSFFRILFKIGILTLYSGSPPKFICTETSKTVSNVPTLLHHISAVSSLFSSLISTVFACFLLLHPSYHSTVSILLLCSSLEPSPPLLPLSLCYLFRTNHETNLNGLSIQLSYFSSIICIS